MVGTALNQRPFDSKLTMPKLRPSELKGYFSINIKEIGLLSNSSQVEFCEKWSIALSGLGIELLRVPNPLDVSDLTKQESATVEKQVADQLKKDKLQIGLDALANSDKGLSHAGMN